MTGTTHVSNQINYIGFLLQEVRFHLRVAALYRHDPADPRIAADFLVLRGVHPHADAAPSWKPSAPPRCPLQANARR